MNDLAFCNLRIYPDCRTACEEAALYLTHFAAETVTRNGRCRLAVSGGTTPWPMLAAFFRSDLPWSCIDLFQTDERMVPENSPERNASHLIPLIPPGIRFHPMPNDCTNSTLEQAKAYEKVLEFFCGTPPVLDLVHLGLGTDGHTASLTPGDPVLDCMDLGVSPTRPYHGQSRLTLTVRTLRAAQTRLWLACGHDKHQALIRCLKRDPNIPATLVYQPSDLFWCDRPAAGSVGDTDATGSKLPLGP
jgi:6-phosphogluconolactonase/glucosamine-6-phosphate isomerase/deaminase